MIFAQFWDIIYVYRINDLNIGPTSSRRVGKNRKYAYPMDHYMFVLVALGPFGRQGNSASVLGDIANRSQDQHGSFHELNFTLSTRSYFENVNAATLRQYTFEDEDS